MNTNCSAVSDEDDSAVVPEQDQTHRTENQEWDSLIHEQRRMQMVAKIVPDILSTVPKTPLAMSHLSCVRLGPPLASGQRSTPVQ